MPIKLSTTISKIDSLSNNANSALISYLCDYMTKNGLSESHINNTLKTNMLFSEFLGAGVSFYRVKSREQIINFLDSKIRIQNLTQIENGLLPGMITLVISSIFLDGYIITN